MSAASERPIAILLCAGFGTRLGALAEGRPKPLLPIAGRPVLDYLLDQIVALPEIDEIHVAVNALHAKAFDAWAVDRRSAFVRRIVIHDNGVDVNAERRGAVGDLAFVLERLAGEHPGGLPLGAFVAAGDNIFRFSLEPLWARFLERRRDQVLALREDDPVKLRRTGVLELDGERVVALHEKPSAPPSTWVCPPLYALGHGALERVAPYLAQGRPGDEIGRFVGDLVERRPVEAWCFPAGERLDIGSPESYRAADRRLRLENVLRSDPYEPGEDDDTRR